MSFPESLGRELTALGCAPAGHLACWLPSGPATLRWHLQFRTLGFAKDQIDAALRYRHPQATDFGWHCLVHLAGARWGSSLLPAVRQLSGGVAVGPIAGWRLDHQFEHRGMTRDEAARQIALDIRDKVLPFIQARHDDQPLHAWLMQDEEPFPWFRSQPLTRLAEIACLEARLGLPCSSVPHLVDQHGAQLRDQLDGVSLPDYVDQVCRLATNGAWR